MANWFASSQLRLETLLCFINFNCFSQLLGPTSLWAISTAQGNFIAKSLQPVINVHSSLYADVNGVLNPSIITNENYRPDLLFPI